MNYLRRFTEYAPELGAAIRDAAARLDFEFLQELNTDEPTSSAFDVCEAFTVFWALWHDGQEGRLYSLGSRFEREFHFRPRPDLCENTLSESSREIYAALQRAFNLTAEPAGTTPSNQRREARMK